MVNEQQWDALLHGNRFTGNDIVFRELEDPLWHQTSVIVSSAVEEEIKAAKDVCHAIIIRDGADKL